MEMQVSTNRKGCITKNVTKLTLKAQCPGEEMDLAKLFGIIREEGVGEVLIRFGDKHERKAAAKG